MIVLITGASGGFGKVLGATLAAKGLTVYGTMRNPVGREAEFPFPILAMEAGNDESVDTCVNTIVEKEGRIDALVNCINTMVIGSVEETSVAELEALYATNVFGVARICKAVVPVMRAQAGGTIINMSSLGGLLAVPLMSAYTSAKFALEAFTEALYQEMKPDNIDVVIMQPVAMSMTRPASGDHLQLVQGVKDHSLSHRMLKRMDKDTRSSKLSPEMVADKIYSILLSDKKPLRVPMDKARAISIVKRLAPQFVVDRLVGGLMAKG